MTVELTTQKRLGSALFYGILVVLAYLVFLVFEPFLAALAWAVVLVVVSYPVYARMARKWGPTLAASASTVGVLLVLIVPTLLVTGAFIHQAVEAVQEVQQQIQSGHFSWVNDLWLRIQERFPDANPGDLTTVIHRYAETGARYLASRLGAVLRNTAVLLFHLAVTILAMFYFFRDADKIIRGVRSNSASCDTIHTRTGSAITGRIAKLTRRCAGSSRRSHAGGRSLSFSRTFIGPRRRSSTSSSM